MSDLQQAVNDHVGKTIQSIEAFNSYIRINIRINFTDGTSMDVNAHGSDEGGWISVTNLERLAST